MSKTREILSKKANEVQKLKESLENESPNINPEEEKHKTIINEEEKKF